MSVTKRELERWEHHGRGERASINKGEPVKRKKDRRRELSTLGKIHGEISELYAELTFRRQIGIALDTVCARHKGLLAEIELEVERVKLAHESGHEYMPQVGEVTGAGETDLRGGDGEP